MNLREKTEEIKRIAYKTGFHKIGIAPVKKPAHSEFLLTWLAAGKHGAMKWMENHQEKRLDISQLYPQARSVIVVAHNYYTSYKHAKSPEKGKISRYAWGRDYHKILKKKLKLFLQKIKEIDSSIEGRIFVDTAPVQEKLWAAEAGIGWQGKNANIITREMGSWVFLGLLVINRKLIYDEPVKDYCGRCNACIEACPTNALEPYRLDAARCISYLTIEYRDQPVPDDLAEKMQNWVFGCDICQDVCPWNCFARETDEPKYHPVDMFLVQPDLASLSSLSEDEFKNLFRGTPVKRAKYSDFIRNVKTALLQISGYRKKE